MPPSGHASPLAVTVVTIIFTILAAIFVAIRLVTRLCLSRNGGWDDMFAVAAMVLSVGLTVITVLEVKHGMGRHGDTLTAEDGIATLKLLYASISVYSVAMFCTKYSIMLQYLRIFPQVGFRKACFGLMFIVFAYASWCFWSGIFFCRPVSAFWQGGIKTSRCLSLEVVWFFNSSGNIATDFAVAVLPLPMVHRLQMPTRTKTALMAIFALGGFTCIVSILRLEAIYAATASKDQMWDNSLAALWSVIEVNTGIICSCLPTLKACLTRAFPRLFTSRRESYAVNGPATATIGSTKHRGRALHISNKASVNITHDALGRGLTGYDEPMQRSYAGRGPAFDRDGFEMFGVGEEDAIKVTTVLNQEVEKDPDEWIERRSDHGSTRELVR